jgi:hypothetical protein
MDATKTQQPEMTIERAQELIESDLWPRQAELLLRASRAALRSLSRVRAERDFQAEEAQRANDALEYHQRMEAAYKDSWQQASTRVEAAESALAEANRRLAEIEIISGSATCDGMDWAVKRIYELAGGAGEGGDPK